METEYEIQSKWIEPHCCYCRRKYKFKTTISRATLFMETKATSKLKYDRLMQTIRQMCDRNMLSIAIYVTVAKDPTIITSYVRLCVSRPYSWTVQTGSWPVYYSVLTPRAGKWRLAAPIWTGKWQQEQGMKALKRYKLTLMKTMSTENLKNSPLVIRKRFNNFEKLGDTVHLGKRFLIIHLLVLYPLIRGHHAVP